MANLPERIKGRSLADLTTRDYLSPTDKSKDIVSGGVKGLEEVKSISNKVARKMGKDSIFDTTHTPTLENKSESKGVFNNTDNTGCSDTNTNRTGDSTPDNRDLNGPMGTGLCSSDFDLILLLQSEIERHTRPMTDSSVVKVEGMINTEVNSLARSNKNMANLKNDDSVIVGAVNTMRKALSPVGDSAKSKLEITAQLNCDKSTYNSGDSKGIKKSLLDSILSGSYCLSISKLVEVISDLVNDPDTDTSLLIESITGTVGTNKGSVGLSILAKTIELAGHDTDNLATVDASFSSILSSVSQHELEEGSVVSHYNLTTASLDTIKPNWDNDIHVSSNNDYLNTLSSSMLLSRDTKPPNITDDLVTNADTARAKKILLANNNRSGQVLQPGRF